MTIKQSTKSINRPLSALDITSDETKSNNENKDDINDTVLVLTGVDEIVSHISTIRELRAHVVDTVTKSKTKKANNPMRKGSNLHMKVSRVSQNEIGSFDIQVMSDESHSDEKGVQKFCDRICLCRDNDEPNSYWLKSVIFYEC